jgi:hypothetical protein
MVEKANHNHALALLHSRAGPNNDNTLLKKPL